MKNDRVLFIHPKLEVYFSTGLYLTAMLFFWGFVILWILVFGEIPVWNKVSGVSFIVGLASLDFALNLKEDRKTYEQTNQTA